jgi:hypothetical protein
MPAEGAPGHLDATTRPPVDRILLPLRWRVRLRAAEDPKAELVAEADLVQADPVDVDVPAAARRRKASKTAFETGNNVRWTNGIWRPVAVTAHPGPVSVEHAGAQATTGQAAAIVAYLEAEHHALQWSARKRPGKYVLI